MNIDEIYKSWVENVHVPEIQRELFKIKDNLEEKYERFYKSLEFGTAGIRGIMGAGTNRVNVYTVGRVTQGFASYLLKKFRNPSVAISYDSRIRSKMFAYLAARIMAANGVKVHLVCETQPTPFLSFAVRKLGCSAGVMITASHNPSQYNGYKCYGKDGAQITEEIAKEIYDEISKVDIFSGVKKMRIQQAFEEKQALFMNKNVVEEYLNCVTNQKINNTDFSHLNVVYTPLNGSGCKLVCKALEIIGVKNLKVVYEQKYPDGNFTTCRLPNPEYLDAFNLAIKYAVRSKADIIIATDPDSDRMGVCARHKGEYKLITGNQIGILLFYYIVKKKREFIDSTVRPVVVRSLVSSKMIDAIAKKENCEVISVPTGFKNIAKEIAKLESSGNLSSYLFGFEESNGYLSGTYARDKDAVSATVLMCEAAAYFKRNNLSLIDALAKISERYGHYGEKNLSFEFKGSKGKEKMDKIISNFESLIPESMGVISVKKDFGMLSLELENKNEIVVRPSGTEPKLKVYILAHENSEKELSEKLNVLSESMEKIINEFSGE